MITSTYSYIDAAPVSFPPQMVDERYVRIQSELKHSLEVLQEEQTRVVKIETIKKSLEVEVKNLTIRLEEVEASAIAGGKRVISKLEARVSEECQGDIVRAVDGRESLIGITVVASF